MVIVTRLHRQIDSARLHIDAGDAYKSACATISGRLGLIIVRTPRTKKSDSTHCGPTWAKVVKQQHCMTHEPSWCLRNLD